MMSIRDHQKPHVQKLCGLCQEPLDPEHQEVERYAGVLCHEVCIEREEHADDDWYAR